MSSSPRVRQRRCRCRIWCEPRRARAEIGQGVEGCAPIPDASSGASVDVPAAPTGEWVTRWGAIAESGSSTLVGTSTGQPSKLDAERQAITRCQAEGAKDCRVAISYYNQCVAYVVPSSGRGTGSITSAVDKSTAIALAKEKCTDAQGGRLCRGLLGVLTA
ncbi:hypothetical protein PEM_10475 [Stenotrophomonas sp. Pemsol]|nr:hypothetical protein PEM_10475 [Stenotrophomonas sp. Pemsol]